MIFKGFKLRTHPSIVEAYCTNPKCKTKPELHEVSNGFLSVSLFCSNCHSVYLLELVRQPKISKPYLRQCLDEVELERVKSEAARDFRKALEAREDVERHIRLNKKSTKRKK
jgi:hypothetical protein